MRSAAGLPQFVWTKIRLLPLFVFATASGLVIAGAVLGESAAAPTTEVVSFHAQIRPILQARCVGCHQPAKASGSLDLTNVSQLTTAADSGLPAVVPGRSQESYLLEMITPAADGTAVMPQDDPPLSADELELIRAWIDQGAHDDSPPDGGLRYSADHPPTYAMPPTITSLDISPDGRVLAVSGRHEVVLHQLSNVSDAEGQSQPLARLVGLSERIESVRFSPDGSQLAVAGGAPSQYGELQVWNVGDRQLEFSKVAFPDTFHGACWSADGKFVSFGCGDNSARVVNTTTGAQVLFQSAHEDRVLDTAFSLGGSHLVTAGRDQSLKLTDVATERFIDNITSITPGALKGGIHSVRRHPKRDEVLVGGADGVPKIYLIHRASKRVIGDDANLLWQFPALAGRVFSVAFNRDGTRIAAASSLNGVGTVQVFGMSAEPEIEDDIHKLLHMPTHTRSNEENEKLTKHFAANIQPLATISIPTGGAYAVALTPDGKQVISAGADGIVRVNDANSGRFIYGFVPVPVEGEERVASSGERMAEGEVPKTFHAPVSFRVDVMPLLAKLGCNSGTCHGSKQGKNGFKLSLRGYDPLSDHRALTDDLAGRRTNRANPGQSLMLLKATAAIPHQGGQRTAPDSEYYEILRRWIAAGMPDDPQAPSVVRLEIDPQNVIAETPGDEQKFSLTAHYTDGTTRDVTEEAFFDSSNIDVAAVADSGQVTALRRGESAILARYEGAYAATTLTVMGDRERFRWHAPAQHNFVDELVDLKLQRVKTLPSPLASDAEFLRRIYLDLTGLPPTAATVREFLADHRPMPVKRNALIDELLASEEFVEHRTNKWADLLQVNSRFLGREGATGLRAWIRSAIAENMPYDQFVHRILTARGSNRQNPPAAYYKTLREPNSLMENTTHLFLGVRFNCNKCHDHPFERWTQDQYYGLAAFFSQVKLEKDPESGDRQIAGTAVESARPLYEITSDGGATEVIHERTGQFVSPQFPYDHDYDCAEDSTLREELAAWITSPDNRYFARSYVNRIWGYLLGTGLIEPLDDIRAGNPPSNPELLARLTSEFVDNGFDTRQLIRTICQSRTYQLSSRTNRWNEDDNINFSHAKLRRLPAEVLYDTVHSAVGSGWQIPSVAAGTRAGQLPDVQIKLPDLFLDQLGRPARESACECERSDDVMLGAVMALVNGPAVGGALVDPSNELSRLEADISDDQALVEELFFRVLSRPPSNDEVQVGIKTLQGPIDEQSGARQRARRLREQVDAKLAEWLEQQHIVDWLALRPSEVTATGEATLTTQGDGSILAGGPLAHGKYVVVLETGLPRITGLRIEALADERLPGGGPGRADNGNFVLSEIRVSAAPLEDPSAIESIGLRNADADHSQGGYPVAGAIDGKSDTGWAVGDEFGKDHVATFELRGRVGYPSGTRLFVELDHQADDDKHQLGRFRISLSGSKPPIRAERQALPVDLVAILRLPANERSERQQWILREYHRSLDDDLNAARRAIDLVSNPRLVGLQDLAWALINTPAFLFNH